MSIFSDLNVLRFVSTSGGADDSGKIPLLNSSGQLDTSFFAGGGNTIAVSDGGSSIGQTFSTLDFTGGGVTATDAGGGVATVNIPTGATDLDTAYNSGNQIDTDGTGNVIIAGTQALQITATNGLDIDTVLDFDGSSFDVDVSGALDLTTSGATNDISLNAVAGSVNLDAGEATGDAISIVASSGGMKIESQSFAATDAIDIHSDGGIVINSVGTQGLTIDASGTISIDSATTNGLNAAANFTHVGNVTTSTSLTLQVDNSNAGGLANSTLVLNAINSGTNATSRIAIGSNAGAGARTDRIGFFGATGVGPASGTTTVTGSRGGNAALASLLTVLANYGLIVNSST